MRCVDCDQELPSDALFCIYCGARVSRPQEVHASWPSRPAATGQTIALVRDQQVAPAPPSAPQTAAAPLQQPWQPSRPHRRSHHRLGFWLMLLGVVLFFSSWSGYWSPTPAFFFSLPGILLIFGLLFYSKKSARGHHDEALRSLVLLGGLALLFATGLIWPGILLLFVIVKLLRPRHRGWC